MIYKIIVLLAAALVGQVVAQSKACTDKKSFRYKKDPRKDCDYIRERQPALCKKWGVKKNCQASCDYPCPCYDGDEFKRGNKMKPCLWLNSAKRKQKECKKKTVAAACPRSCGTCCGNVKSFKFKTNEGPARNCSWLGADDFRIKQYCSANWIAKRCTKACGKCKNYGLPPTPAPEKQKTDDSPFDDD